MSTQSNADGAVVEGTEPEPGGSGTPSWPDRLRGPLETYGPALAIVLAQLVLFPVSSGIFVRGLIVGALTALIALGMALIYRANRIVNFAQAHMGYAPALLAFLLMDASGVPYLLAVGIALVAAIGLGAATERLVIRRFVRAPRLLLTIATLGLGQVLAGLTRLLPSLWDREIVGGRMPAPFDAERTIGNVVFDVNDLLGLTVAPLAVALVALFLQRSDVGVAIRASADNPERAALLGVPVERLQTVVWSLAAALAFVTVFLRSGILGLPAETSSSIASVGVGFSLTVLLRSLVALLLGRMTNLAAVASSAVALGVLEQAIWHLHGQALVDPILGLIVVIALVLRRHQVGRGNTAEDTAWRAADDVRRVPAALLRLQEVQVVRWVVLGAVGAVALVLPWILAADQTFEASALLVYVLLGLSLVLLSGWGGIVSLGQIAYFAIGAAVAGWAVLDLGVDLLPAMLLASVAGALVAAVVGIPALRLRGLYLAVSSFAFAMATTSYLLNDDHFGWVPTERVGRANLLGGFGVSGERAVYYLVLVVLVLVAAGLRNLGTTRFGRALVALRENDRAAEAYSVDALRVRLAAFALSGAIAALAGALFVHHESAYNPGSYGPLENLEVFTMVVTGGMTTILGPLLGALYLFGSRWFLPSDWAVVVAGSGVLAVLWLCPGGLASLVYAGRDRWLRRVAAARRLDVAAYRRARRDAPPGATGAEPDTGAGPDTGADQVIDVTTPLSSDAGADVGADVDRVIDVTRPPSGSSSDAGVPAGAGSAAGRAKPRADRGSADDVVGPPSRPAAPGQGGPGARNDPLLLDVQGVDAGYGGVQVLFDVDLEVREGEAVALLGTNGAGKSTLLRAVSGLTPPKRGRVVFDGADVTGRPPHRVAASGVIQMPGGHGVFPTLTVAENMRVAGWLQRRDATTVVAGTERVYRLFPILAERSNEPAGNLSGGQQQMLALGMAVVGRPRLLMVDELSLGLAPSVVAELLRFVDHLRGEGTTLLVVEQSVNLALEIADRAVFMEHGEVRFAGPARELLDRPDLLRSVFLGSAAQRVAAARRRAEAEAAALAGLPEFVASRLAPTRPASGESTDRDDSDEGSSATTDEAPGPVLRTAGLGVAFGGVNAVEDVSIEVAAGEIVGVIGPNGAGKTTLFDLLSGYLRPDAGRIWLGGRDVTRLRAASRARRGLGRSFQDARLFPSLTVEQTVATALERWVAVRDPLSAAFHLPNVYDSERAVGRRVDELVDLLGLGDYRTLFVAELSTGTRRVVDLACLLAHRPQVVLLDEPAAGIAQREVEQLAPLIRRIRDEMGASVLIVEHDIPLVEEVADRLVAMDRGRVLAVGRSHDVLSDRQVIDSYLGRNGRGDGAAPRRSGALARGPRRPGM